MSGSGSGGSSTGSCASVSELRSSVEDDNKSNSSGICSSMSVEAGGQMMGIAGDDFDAAIEESMEMLEKNALEGIDDELRHLSLTRRSSSVSPGSGDSGATTPSTEEESFTVPPLIPALDLSLSEEDIDKKLALFNQNIQTRSPDGRHAVNHHVSFPMPPPPPMPTARFDRYGSVVLTGRRRLSQCKEEENEEEETSSGAVNSALVKKSSSLTAEIAARADRKAMHAKEPMEEEDEGEEEVILPVEIEEVKAPVSRFTVTKTEKKEEKDETVPTSDVKTTLLRPGVEALLRNSSAKQNSQTIHFPCSTPVNNRLSVQSMFEPHLDKRFFDTSLVEIRSLNDSSQTINEESTLNDSVDGDADDIWVKRSEKVDVSLIWRNKYLLGCGVSVVVDYFACGSLKNGS